MTYTKIQTGIMLFVLFIEVVWINVSTISIDYGIKEYIYNFIFVVFLFVLMFFYKTFRPDPRIVLLLETLFFALAYCLLMMLLCCLVATANQPLVDSTLVSIDDYFGVYVPSIDFWFRKHKAWNLIFECIYSSYLFQFIFVFLYFSYYVKTIQLQRFLMQFMIGLAITIVISAFFPALGPYDWYQYKPSVYLSNALQHLLELRQNIVDLNKEPGIVTFPSFHTVMALLYAYTFRNEKKIIFIPILILNLLMIFSCLPIGEHYFADLLGAVPVFLVAIGIEALLYKWVMQPQLNE